MISKKEKKELITNIAEAYSLLNNLLIFTKGNMLDLEKKNQLKDVVEFVEFKFDDILQKLMSDEFNIFLDKDIMNYLDDASSVLLKFKTLIVNE
jgi:hypothetical protein